MNEIYIRNSKGVFYKVITTEKIEQNIIQDIQFQSDMLDYIGIIGLFLFIFILGYTIGINNRFKFLSKILGK